MNYFASYLDFNSLNNLTQSLTVSLSSPDELITKSKLIIPNNCFPISFSIYILKHIHLKSLTCQPLLQQVLIIGQIHHEPLYLGPHYFTLIHEKESGILENQINMLHQKPSIIRRQTILSPNNVSTLKRGQCNNLWIKVLHIDLWQTRKLGTGCSSCVNRRTAHAWVDSRKQFKWIDNWND